MKQQLTLKPKCWKFLEEFHGSCPWHLNWYTFLLLNLLNIVPRLHPFWRGNNILWEAMTNTSHDMMLLLGSSTNHLVASPVNDSENKWRLIDFYETFLNVKGVHTSKKPRICLWKSYCSRPSYKTFECIIWRFELVISNVASSFDSAMQIFPLPPTCVEL